ncbi:Zinc finger C3HC4 type (RING finger) Ring finger domain [Trypanosoma vivax]|uniref:RING-type E3 ubiquitin transferase n=1 Tax=Trypanosoma vivax (strain Y486) TaxID=1055687 RepID=G0U6T0_TRYVY|nr:Zinc finger C3HC4 type (RING finger) Ring finger domain [Trypanosoma vivax]CCC51585.1 conserved hypothetical protein [Trypanosoma vivax Y486]
MSQGDFSCPICYNTAAQPVVTRCGHLFCWGCLSRWLRRPSALPECPTCRGRVDERIQGDIIPLYGMGKHAETPSTSQQSSKAPPNNGQRWPSPPPRPTANRASSRARSGGQQRSYSSNPLDNIHLLLPFGFCGNFFFATDVQVAILMVVVLLMYHNLPWRQWAQSVRQLFDIFGTRTATTPTGGYNSHSSVSTDATSSGNGPGRGQELPLQAIVWNGMLLGLAAFTVSFILLLV